MAADDAREDQEPLSPEQRLDILEKKVGSNKIILLVLALFLIIAISVSVTIAAIGIAGDDSGDGASAEQFVSLQQSMDQLQDKVLTLDTRLAKFKSDLDLQDIKIANSGNRVIQSSMIEQEQHYQAFLVTLRSAVYDLAHMVPGSRAWLELYSDQIDKASAQSVARQKRLEQIESSEEKVDSFFGDF